MIKFFKNIFVFFAFAICTMVACSKSSSTQNESVLTPQQNNPAYTWAYVEEIPKEDHTPYAICGRDFQLDAPCEALNAFCHVNNHLYACFPTDLNVVLSGKVLDPKGHGIPGVHVTSGLGFDKKVNDPGVTTDDHGRFTILSRACTPVFWAQKDGYQSLSRYFFTISSVSCKQFVWSYEDITLRLQTLNRTVAPDHDRTPTKDRCVMAGRALDVNAAPIEDVQITANTEKSQQTSTDKDGYYYFDFAGPCPEYCSAFKIGYINPEPMYASHNHVSCYLGKPGDFILKPVN